MMVLIIAHIITKSLLNKYIFFSVRKSREASSYLHYKILYLYPLLGDYYNVIR